MKKKKTKAKKKYQCRYAMDAEGVTALALDLDIVMHYLATNEAIEGRRHRMSLKRWDGILKQLLRYANTPRAKGVLRMWNK